MCSVLDAGEQLRGGPRTRCRVASRSLHDHVRRIGADLYGESGQSTNAYWREIELEVMVPLLGKRRDGWEKRCR